MTIRELAELIKKVVGFNGEILFDTSKPDGPPKKLMDSSKLNRLGWKPSVTLETGLTIAYKDFLSKI
jgi:GDP-L-fucose synthase